LIDPVYFVNRVLIWVWNLEIVTRSKFPFSQSYVYRLKLSREIISDTHKCGSTVSVIRKRVVGQRFIGDVRSLCITITNNDRVNR